MFKKAVKILVIVLVIIILLNIVLFITFSIPRVQKYAADTAIEKLKPKLGTEVSLDGIRIKLFNKVELKGLYVEDQQQDTLLFVEKLGVRLNFTDLFRNKISFDKVEMQNFVADVKRADIDAPFNFQFIIDAFAPTDTTKVKEEKPPWLIRADDLVLKNGWLRYNIVSEPETPGQFNTNHLDVRDFNLQAKMHFLSVQDMRADIKSMRLWEHSGLKINDFNAKVNGKSTQLTSNRVFVSVNNTDLLISNARFDTDSKLFSVEVKSETIDPKDATIFVPGFAHLDKPFSLQANLEGQLPEVVVKSLTALYGTNTRIDFSGLISDYSEFDRSEINIDIQNVSTSQQDLESLIRVAAPDYRSPEQLVALGNLNLQMSVRGKLYDFTYQGIAKSEQGDVTLSGKGKADKQFNYLSLEGPVKATNIQVAKIIGESAGLDDATIMADVDFSLRKDEDVTVIADGHINSVLYKGFEYKDLFFDGVYSGSTIVAKVKTESDLNKLDLFADLDFGSEKKIEVKGTVDKLDLRPFVQNKGWEMPSLTVRINGDLSGSTFDDMVGFLVLDSTSLSDVNFIYNPGPIYLQALTDAGKGKKIQIYSSILEGDITGNYYFTTIGKELMYALHPHLPSVIKEPQRERDEFWKNNFNFNFLIKNTEDISYALSLPFYNVEPATISGGVNMVKGEGLLLNAHVPRLMFGNNDIRETRIKLNSGQLLGISLDANTYLVQDNGHINARLNTAVASDSITNRLAFDIQNKVAKSTGTLLISMGFMRDMQDQLNSYITLHPSKALFNGKNIYFDGSIISHRKDRIEINKFGVREENMLLLGIDGVASTNSEDNVRIYFNNTELESILAAFNLQNYKGSLNGDIYIHQALQQPIIQTEDLRIENIAVYNDTIGTLRIEGDWDNTNKGLALEAYLANGKGRTLEVNGFLPTAEDSPKTMDVNLRINDFALNTIQPLTTGVFSELKGSLNSNIHISGKMSEPVMQGWLGIDQGLMKVAYTNVTYHVSDTIKVESSRIGADDLLIRDQNGNLATISLALSHTNFGRMVYSANLRMDDFMVLNNQDRTDLMVYGLLNLTGNMTVTGSSAGIFGDAYFTNVRQSKVTVITPQIAQAEEYSGIIYINTPQKEDSLSFLRKRSETNDLRQINTPTSSGIPINIRGLVDLNPMLNVGVLLNPTTGNAIDVTGNGEITVIYNTKATPIVRVIGDYVIDEGKFHYNLQSLPIDFNIKKGSTLTMIGDPLNTQFNIIAYNRVNADLGTLDPSFKVELSNTRVPVDAMLEIRGNLEAMDLSYNIDLPESSNDIRQRVNSYISTEEARIRQFASLVTFRKFYSSEGITNLNISGTEMVASLTTGLLTSGLDALFARALNDNWSVNTTLESQDGTFENTRMGLDVTRRLLGDRLRITGNFSYGDNTMLATNQEFMTEFEAMWDINNWLMLRAYNRANDRFYRRAPYTQGVGVVVTKEGQTLYDLFRFKLGRTGKEDKK